jgi:hypothetical protein
MEEKIEKLLLQQHQHKQVAAKPPWPVDVVYTFCGMPESENCRFTENLKYSIRSVFQNIPWFRKIILIVQDDFILPFWMKEHIKSDRLQMVYLHNFIPIKYLPNYNGHNIQSWICRIRSISTHFLYLHDDMYVMRPTPWTCFFTKQGVPINRHHPGPANHGIHPDHRIPYVRMWINAITNYGIQNTRIHQQILPYNKNLLNKYFKKYKSDIERASKLRGYTGEHDFDLLRFATSITSTSGEGLLLKTDSNIDFFSEAGDVETLKKIKKVKPRFLCINNAVPVYTHVYDMLRKIFPNPTPFEEANLF